MKCFLSILKFVGKFLSYMYPIGLEKCFNKVVKTIYSGFISGRMKSSGAFFDGRIKLVGGEYVTIGDNSFIGKGVRLLAWNKFKDVVYNPTITIGNNTAINSGCMISCINSIVIGDNVGIASNCVIVDNTHGDFRDHKFTFESDSDVPDVFLQGVHDRVPFSKGPVIIEDGVHLGEGAIIMPGVKIGRHSIVGAHAVVTKKVPPFSIVAGDPATIVMSFGKGK